MVSGVGVQRQGWRIECGDKCVLRHNDQRADCILVDISVSGVLVSCHEDFAERLQPGDMCGIFLCGDPQVCATEVTCTVTRRDDSRIGLRFPSGTE
jgi:hypothetical protein